MGRIQRKKPSGSKKKKSRKSASNTATVSKPVRDHGVKKASPGKSVVKAEKKKQAATASPVAIKPKDNIFTKTAQFLREVKVELKKVTWPSRKQTIGSTAVVIALVMIISLFLGVVDFGISSLIRIVLQ